MLMRKAIEVPEEQSGIEWRLVGRLGRGMRGIPAGTRDSSLPYIKKPTPAIESMAVVWLFALHSAEAKIRSARILE
jgi:hypothetical protein